ncbi:MAG: T9SS type A sorting domain-containing protein [Chitinophagales bacterium]
MTYLYPRFNFINHLSFLFLIVGLIAGFSSFSQDPVPELMFMDGILKTGPGTQSAGEDGAVYIFRNVTANVDALIMINGRSSSHVSLSSIDLIGPNEDPVHGTGYDNAWQPRVAYDGGYAPANQNWWMEFQISFVQHSDNSNPVSVSQFCVTGLDVDGDGVNLHECLSFYALQSYTLEQNTLMSTSNMTGCVYNQTALGKEFDGPTKNYPNITPTATDVMVCNYYKNTNSFVVRVGAKTGSTASNAADRMNSLWFRTFQFVVPVSSPLPLSLVDFAAHLNDKKVVLDWATEMELNTSHFTIQRSADGESFDDDGIVIADGESKARQDYSFTDNVSSMPNKGLIYYRLKMVDLDSKYRYSEVVVVRIVKSQQTTSITVFPNPAVNDLRVTIPVEWQNRSISYNIYSSNGALMKQKISGNAGQTETLHVADLPSGWYVVKTSAGSETAVQTFMKVD